MSRKRRTKADIEELKRHMRRLCYMHYPLTVRNLYYRMVSAGLIDKTQAEYKNVTVRLCGEMREAGEIPWDRIVDETRLMRKPDSYDNLHDALQSMQNFYRRDFWNEQDVYVEVWCESDSVAGMIIDETSRFDVPLMSARGFASKSFLWSTAQKIQSVGKPAHLVYVGDYDPSGLHIDRNIEEGIRRYAPDAEIHFERIAITPEQIQEFDLPSRPPKKGDSRAKGFNGECVETEALEPAILRQIVRDAIEVHIDAEAYERVQLVEAAERETLQTVVMSLDP